VVGDDVRVGSSDDRQVAGTEERSFGAGMDDPGAAAHHGERLPVGPPSSVQFQGVAELLANDDPHIAGLPASGHLRSITSHGELDEPLGCFVRITPERHLHTYGLGMPLRRLLRNPLHAAGVAPLS
jgi:hypothetical protein